jgi:hypothetical protein
MRAQAAVRWHSHLMTFTDLPLRDAVVLFNRRNQQQLVLADAAVGERRIGGTFAADQVEAFVRLLRRTATSRSSAGVPPRSCCAARPKQWPGPCHCGRPVRRATLPRVRTDVRSGGSGRTH